MRPQHSESQLEMNVAHSGCEQLHSAQAVVNGRCGVQIGTVGVGQPGMGIPWGGLVMGVPPIGTVIGGID